MNGKPTSFHSTEPCHLSFGELMDSSFQLQKHFIVCQLTYDMLRQEFIFQTVINLVVRMNSFCQLASHLFYPAFFQALFKAASYFFSSQFPINIHTYN